ncbi:hypothetical protein GCK32_022554 [Trichostrongylus colubriformis]|uniref:Uncharacterized protein n=1 Tax=Trichostrongylus colubriformis TaxID=6319 RepID=A0AAN8IKS0_TRICO
MSDDLSAFFAKKKDKKKKNVVKMEDVGHILELKVKRQVRYYYYLRTPLERRRTISYKWKMTSAMLTKVSTKYAHAVTVRLVGKPVVRKANGSITQTRTRGGA